VIQALLAKNREISQAIREGRLPPRDFYHTPTRPAFACAECPIRHTWYQAEGYFQDDLLLVPPRLEHHLARVDPTERVLG
jgi:hypothetical protein